jgi:protein TonB
LREDAASASVTDRLSSTLFVAALFHGVVILGVTFTATPLDDGDELPTLKITLVADGPSSEISAEDADYLAQRSQEGSGQLAPGDRPTTTAGQDSARPQQGDPAGTDTDDGRPRELAAGPELLLTRNESPQQLETLPRPNEDPAVDNQTAAQVFAGPSIATLATEIDEQATLPNEEPRELFASPSTRESTLAPYLNAWRNRIEQIGTLNFPAQARAQAASENPTLEVAIGADGDLVEIVIRESSGNPSLDQAALTILRLAAPFEPLPTEIRAEYDVLRFAYEWDFESGGG